MTVQPRYFCKACDTELTIFSEECCPADIELRNTYRKSKPKISAKEFISIHYTREDQL